MSIKHVLLIKSKYRVKFLNRIRREGVARKFGKFRAYIINKKDFFKRFKYLLDSFN